MLLILLALFLVMALAGLVAAFTAYPHRGESIPHAEWLSDALVRARERIRP